MQQNERYISIQILNDIDKRGTFSGEAIDGALRKEQFSDKRERAFVTRLTEGTIEKKLTIDTVIERYSKVKVPKLKPLIRNAIRTGIYQIFYMDSVPDAAAVSEAVNIVKAHGMKNLSGFVNAILRNVIRDKEELRKMIGSDPCLKYSVPKWLYEYLVENYGADYAEKILADTEAFRPTTIRVNTNLVTKEKLTEMLEADGIKVRNGNYSDNSLLIENYDFIRRIKGFREGFFIVQDESGMAAVEALGIKPGSVVIDMCAAPGGKSLYASLFVGKDGLVRSFDISEAKKALIEENAERLKASNVSAFVKDALKYDPELGESADYVIADVPCTGLGVMGRKNDIKYRVKPSDMETLSKQAGSILENADRYLKTGGRLLYSTCTITKEENGMVAQRFLKKHPGYDKIAERQFLQGIDKCDGFYYLILQKN